VNGLRTLAAGAFACVALVALTAIHLGSQGPNYDELHQAPAAFCYVGSNPTLFTRAFRGIPLLNMTYSGALKSGVYGLYLRYGDPRFSVVAWRSIGIAFVGAGLFLFALIAGRSLPLESVGIFLCLFLSDISVLVMTRHDAGPTALAQALRLVFVALWVSIALDPSGDFKLALAGLVVGVSIWEKLSSVVLLAPLCLLVLTVSRRRRRGWMAAGLGLLAGALPLIAANVGSYAYGKGFVSLRDASPDRAPLSFRSLADYTYDVLSLGQGRTIQTRVFGVASGLLLERAEAALMGVLVLAILIAATRAGRSDRLAVHAAVLAGSYAALVAALAFLPRDTSVHHWIIGTPFQYAAMALALAALNRQGPGHRLLLAACLCLIAIRVPALVEVERALASGKSSPGYDPGFNRLARLAAARSAHAVFIASDWGSATQLYCGSNGRDDAVYEPIWNTNPRGAVADIAARTPKSTIYLVTTGLGPRHLAETSSAILDAMTLLPDWQAVSVEPEFTNLGPVQVRKFERRKHQGFRESSLVR
jgi:hypothetical protein